jgi:hypothetical protein
MLRMLVLALVLAAPAASAEQFPDSAIGAPVMGDDGMMLAEVTAVERNADGQIVAAEIPGLEPADAPFASSDMVAEEDRDHPWTPTRSTLDDRSTRGGVSARTATR